MAARIREKDWSRTPLGPVERWSPSLRTTTSILLANRFPMLLWWGPDSISLYNDAYIPVLGIKHPAALGLPVRECWSEIYDVLRPLILTPLNGGPPTWSEDLLLEIRRHGFLEETHWTVAYSPVPDQTAPNGIGGVLATVHEITAQVLSERRLKILRDLGVRCAAAKSPADACELGAEVLGEHPKDVPFALIYLVSEDGGTANLTGVAGVEGGGPASPVRVDLTAMDDATPWPLAQVLRGNSQLIEDLPSPFRASSEVGAHPSGARWSCPSPRASPTASRGWWWPG